MLKLKYKYTSKIKYLCKIYTNNFYLCSTSSDHILSQEQKYQNKQKTKQIHQQKLTKRYGTFLSNIILHVESPQFRKSQYKKYLEFPYDLYLQKHAWCCFHIWLIYHRAGFMNSKWHQFPFNFMTKVRMRYYLSQFNWKQMYEYSEKKDEQIYQQLRRQSDVIWWSLDDLFVYNFKGKSIEQLIEEDMGLIKATKQEEQQTKKQQNKNMEQIKEYINRKISQMDSVQISKIKWQIYNWKL